jgi:triacylglycerol lipase
MKPQEEALICAQASEAIYGTVDDPAGQASSQTAMNALGFSNFVWIDLTGVFKDLCAFIVSSNDYHLLVFRGTKMPQDWMTDLACTPVRFDWVFPAAPAIGEIHAGFGHCLSDGLNDIISALSPRDKAKPLLITGHSLGGALAALAGACFTVLGSSVPTVSAIYTFGQPRIGLHDFCNTYSRILANKLIRFVNKQDLVPRVPFRGWDYSDEGTMIHFDSSGKPAVESLEWRTFLARSLQSFEDFFEIMSHIQVDVGDHSMVGYQNLIELNQPTLAPLLQQVQL